MTIKSVSKYPILPNNIDPALFKQLSSTLTEHATAINQIIETESNSGGDGTGTVWYSGDTTPDVSVGANGDFYLQISTGNIYQKDTTWSYRGNISGTGIEVSTRVLRQLAMPQNNHGRRRYTHHSIVPTSATTVPLCCIDVHGMGFQNGSTGVQSYARMKFTVGTWDLGTTMEVVLHRSGMNWRLDIQDLMGGGCPSTNYFAQSRGGSMPHGSELAGMKIIPNGTSSPVAAGTTGSTSLSQHKHEDYGNPGVFDGYAYQDASNEWDTSHTHTIPSHYHAINFPYKLNSTVSGVTYNSAIDSGSTASIVGLKFYAVNGETETELATPYETQTGTHVKVYITNCPVYSGYRTMVNTEIEFADNNHTIWFYDSEQAILGNSAWETKPIVAVTGASDVQGTDLNAMIASGYSYLWTEKRGYYNYGKDGAMCYELFDATNPRMKVENGKLYLRRLPTDSWSTQDFTHCIIGAGTNEATNTVLARRGCKGAATIEWLAKIGQNGVTEISNIINDIDTVVQMVKTTPTKPVLLLFSGIQDPQGGIDTGGNWAITNISDGSSAGNMTATDWANIAIFWDTLADAIYEYAVTNDIEVIDWNILSTQYSFSNEPGGLMAVGHHYNVNGWLKIADYADVVRRI